MALSCACCTRLRTKVRAPSLCEFFFVFADKEGFVGEFGEYFIEGFALCVLDDGHGCADFLLVGPEPPEVVVGDPVAEEENVSGDEDEEPPVGELLFVFLNAVLFVLAEDDFTFFFGVLAVADFGFVGHGGGKFASAE